LVEAKDAAGLGAATEMVCPQDRNNAKPGGEPINQRGPEMPCFRIIRKWMSMNTASSQGITKVCRL
jgi:hypothetical protein